MLNKTIVTMGHGDVVTGMAFDKQTGVGLFVFMQMDCTREPGTPVPEFEGAMGAGDADVTIAFKDVAAVDLMISRLSALRETMGGAE